ncbi:HGL224Wp [Eremothecium sinecaudum]|uniref:HGL224Wp n=1 Tax=Eremothecium sinecaudum TaxID=45286 RepID=A0A0X8HV68_9SACH|nr:HGL224Wp [Eremothecium sinecaudum]AMD22116.1 HGL224Wp [Eremothecium sinecaudum]
MKLINGRVHLALLGLCSISYYIEVRAIAHVCIADRINNGDPLFLLFTHILPWLLLYPIALVYYRLKDDIPFAESLRNTKQTCTMGDAASNQRFQSINSVLKLVTLSTLLIISMYSFMTALSIAPVFDVAIIHNTSMLEIIVLFATVAGVATNNMRSLAKRFISIFNALIGIVLVAYFNASSDLLSGKFSINPSTGESSDPFLFDRLKASLICGLGSLFIGPYVFLLERWCINTSRQITGSGRWLKMYAWFSAIGLTSILMLSVVSLYSGGFKYMFHMCGSITRSPWFLLSMICGKLPTVMGSAHLIMSDSIESLTLLPILRIIVVWLGQWCIEAENRILTLGEVVGFLMLVISFVIMFISHSRKG